MYFKLYNLYSILYMCNTGFSLSRLSKAFSLFLLFFTYLIYNLLWNFVVKPPMQILFLNNYLLNCFSHIYAFRINKAGSFLNDMYLNVLRNWGWRCDCCFHYLSYGLNCLFSVSFVYFWKFWFTAFGLICRGILDIF